MNVVSSTLSQIQYTCSTWVMVAQSTERKGQVWPCPIPPSCAVPSQSAASCGGSCAHWNGKLGMAARWTTREQLWNGLPFFSKYIRGRVIPQEKEKLLLEISVSVSPLVPPSLSLPLSPTLSLHLHKHKHTHKHTTYIHTFTVITDRQLIFSLIPF